MCIRDRFPPTWSLASTGPILPDSKPRNLFLGKFNLSDILTSSDNPVTALKYSPKLEVVVSNE